MPVRAAIALLVLALTASPAGAATQARDDPSDVPAGPSGKADLRTVAWDVDGAAATLTVGLDASTFGAAQRAEIGVHVLIDSGADGIADAQVVAARNADGTSVDLELRTLDGALSTPDCQDLAGKATSEKATVTTTIAGDRETFAFSFDANQVPGGLSAFRWAVFAQAPPDPAAAGPWDLMPDAADPKPGSANPGDRRCGDAKGGLSVRLTSGFAFPDATAEPTPTPEPTPAATPTATPGKPPGPTASLVVAGAPPKAGSGVTLSAKGTVPAAGTHIVAYQWDMNGDGKIDTNTGTNPIAHLILGTRPQTVVVHTVDSNFASASATLGLNPGAAAAGCEAERSIGVLRVRAACIREDGDVLVAEPGLLDGRSDFGDVYAVSLNGVALVTRNPRATVRFDMARNEIQATGRYVVYLLNGPQGDIMLFESGTGGFTWPLPAGAGRSGGEPTSLVSLEIAENCNGADATGGALSTTCATVPGGFPMTGRFDLGVDTDTYEATIDVTAAIDFDAVTIGGRVRLRADIILGSIRLDGIGFSLEDMEIGPVAIHHLRFDYEPPGTGDPLHEGDLWDVAASIEMSELFSAEGRMIFIGGRFNYMRADLMFTPGILVYPAIFLNRFAAELGIDPVRFGGGLGASFAAAFQINANFLVAYLADRTTAVRLDGVASLYGYELGNGYGELWSNGYFTFGGMLGIRYPRESPVLQVSGATDFWSEAQPDGTMRWQGDGNLTLVLAGIRASIHGFVNNDWISGCLDRIATGTYNWRTRVSRAMFGCDLTPYVLQPTTDRAPLRPPERGPRAFAALAEPPAKALTVTAGERALVLAVDGAGGAPVVTLTDPKGRVYTPTSEPAKFAREGDFSSAYLPQIASTILRVERPIAGEWVLTPQPGSPAIKEVITADALAPLKIAASVTGKGRSRLLTWSAKGLEGRSVRFTERGKNTGRTIAVSTKERGRVRFALQDGSAGRRSVVAEVSSGGVPVAAPTVARYRAPGPRKPGRPGKLKLRRKVGIVTLQWPKLKAAKGFVIHVRGTDGRREVYFRTAKRRRVDIRLVGPATRLDVRVAGYIGGRRLVGRERRATVKAVRRTGG